MSDVSLTESSAAAPAPARPPLPTAPPPLSSAAAAAETPDSPVTMGGMKSRELTAEQKAEMAQLSQQVLFVVDSVM